jgi:hypothetical protein
MKEHQDVGPIGKYLYNKNMRENTPFQISGKKTGYILDGEIIPAEQFSQMFPLEIIRPDAKGPNPCIKNRWRSGQKSY